MQQLKSSHQKENTIKCILIDSFLIIHRASPAMNKHK